MNRLTPLLETMLWRDEKAPEFDSSDEILGHFHQDQATQTCIGNALPQPEKRSGQEDHSTLLTLPTSQGEHSDSQIGKETTPLQSASQGPVTEKILYPKRAWPAFSPIKGTDDKWLITDPTAKPKRPVGRPKGNAPRYSPKKKVRPTSKQSSRPVKRVKRLVSRKGRPKRVTKKLVITKSPSSFPDNQQIPSPSLETTSPNHLHQTTPTVRDETPFIPVLSDDLYSTHVEPSNDAPLPLTFDRPQRVRKPKLHPDFIPH